MTVLSDSQLAYQLSSRIRRSAEELLALNIMLREDTLFAARLGTPPEVIEDGLDGAHLPFTRQHWEDYFSLTGLILAAVDANPLILAACQSMQVRGIDIILQSQASTGSDQDLEPAKLMLRNRIAPRARRLRAIRYWANDFVRVLTPLTLGYNDEDTIADSHGPVTLGAIRALLAFLAGMIAPEVNNEPRAAAIDAACSGIPLEVA